MPSSATSIAAMADADESPSATSHEDDASQWTRVIRKGKAIGRQEQVLRLPRAGPESNFPPNPHARLTLQDIRTDHEKIPRKWRASPASSALADLIIDNRRSHAPITNAVCLGLGSFDPEDGSFDATRRSHVQLDAFLAITKLLSMPMPNCPPHGSSAVFFSLMCVCLLPEADSNEPVHCVFQEPRFTATDKELIKDLGHTVVDSPGAFDLIDSNALVFGVHLYRDIWASALDKSLPAMFVGTGWDVWDECPGSDKSADFERIREMDMTYDKFAFPQDDHHTFSSTSIYWRKRDAP
ncbi:hypothetical protein UCRPA7_6272 [Phaeoacremonium minimum UCRPA7]|uniref:SRR1-like domain-containing protein n=1 Tax=Phaeoacremonium minimum (strain UCR-PA7) TaxID=1286976 RepID=R8BFZ3_PHAM7|nr:hypothetical protein UCRPA7_6272 [Phaeoacremonium minimum UCRPA7]EON98218.1 hypothetical protein UCRPA7_6272 [Phaeoacremonium minimum UCRPA7]